MVDLRRTPSIQHTVALIGSTVDETVQNFRALEEAKIPFTLEPGRRLFKPLMEGATESWALTQIALQKKPIVRSTNSNLIRAFAPYAADKALPWFRPFPKDYFPVGSGVVIPLNPSGFWFAEGQFKILWVQAWKGRTLDPLQRAIFHTIMDQRIFTGDFENAGLEWVDLREQETGKGRGLEILGRADFGLLSDRELRTYLQILLDAFLIYSDDRKRRREESRRRAPPAEAPLFDAKLPE